MAITAQEAAAARFTESRRGFDQNEVEQFRSRVVEILEFYERELTGLTEALETARMRGKELAEAEEAVKRTFIAASQTKRDMLEEAEAMSAQTVAAAEQKAATTTETAAAAAAKMRDDARAEAEATVSAAKASAAEAESHTRGEIQRMERRLAQLRTAVGDIEDRLRIFARGGVAEVGIMRDLIQLETSSLSEIPPFQGAAIADETPLVSESPTPHDTESDAPAIVDDMFAEDADLAPSEASSATKTHDELAPEAEAEAEAGDAAVAADTAADAAMDSAVVAEPETSVDTAATVEAAPEVAAEVVGEPIPIAVTEEADVSAEPMAVASGTETTDDPVTETTDDAVVAEAEIEQEVPTAAAEVEQQAPRVEAAAAMSPIEAKLAAAEASESEDSIVIDVTSEEADTARIRARGNVLTGEDEPSFYERRLAGLRERLSEHAGDSD